MRIGLYPGTFDPIHNGHTDIIRRATRMVDRLVIAVAKNAGKGPLFNLEERTRLVEREAALLMAGNRTNGCKVEVKPFANLLMHFVRDEGGRVQLHFDPDDVQPPEPVPLEEMTPAELTTLRGQVDVALRLRGGD